MTTPLHVLSAAIVAATVVPTAGSSPPEPAPPAGEQLVVGPECAERDGATITHVADVVVPAIDVAAVTVDDVMIDGETVPGVVVDGFTIPEQVSDAGCIIAYEAPGGCLGAVEITAATIPTVTIPASIIPEVVLPNGEVAATRTISEVVVPGVSREGARTEHVCQIELDGELPTVSRAGVVREGFSRPGASRPGASRREYCVVGGCLPAVRVDAVRIDPVDVPDVDVDPARLRSEDLDEDAPDVEVITGNDDVSFVAPGDVLFDTDSATLRPDAAASLVVIADEIAAIAAPDATIRVEGHTDDRAEDAYNLDLSVRRAQAVADWMTANAGIAVERLVVTGRGESAPAYPNDSDANRRLNRRVVITVEEN